MSGNSPRLGFGLRPTLKARYFSDMQTKMAHIQNVTNSTAGGDNNPTPDVNAEATVTAATAANTTLSRNLPLSLRKTHFI
jgi:hypothetical protein